MSQLVGALDAYCSRISWATTKTPHNQGCHKYHHRSPEQVSSSDIRPDGFNERSELGSPPTNEEVLTIASEGVNANIQAK